MAYTKPTIRAPQEGETLEEYFRGYTDEELQTILSDPTLAVQFSKALLDASSYVQREPTDELQRLWDEIKRLNNYGRLRHFVKRLQSVRLNLMRSLIETANHIEQYAKYGSLIRLISSASDIAGTVGGLWMRDSAIDHSNLAFTAATSFGFLGTISTISEIYLSKSAFDDVMLQIQKDQKLYVPIDRWFQQTEMLHQAMLDVFPSDTTDGILKEFLAAEETRFSGVDLLARMFRTVIEKDIKHIRNATFVRNMLTLFSRSDIIDLCEWVIFQQSPIYLDISKMMLQIHYSPLKFILCQNLPALSPKDQNLWSPPIWARITLNFATMLHALKTLRRSEVCALASDMRNLQSELGAQLTALERIIQYVDSRRNDRN